MSDWVSLVVMFCCGWCCHDLFTMWLERARLKAAMKDR